MAKKILLCILIVYSCSAMQIERIERASNEKTPLLITIEDNKKILHQAHAMIKQQQELGNTYFSHLPTEIRCNLSLYLKPSNPALSFLLETIRLNQNQAEKLYEKFYISDRLNVLSQLIKNEESQKYLRKVHKQQQIKIAHLSTQAKSIVAEQNAEKMLTFMSENALPLETLEELTVETLPPVQEKVVICKDITLHVNSNINGRENLGKIASALGKLHDRQTACAFNFVISSFTIIGLCVLAFTKTHLPLNDFDMTECWEDQSGKCFWDFNRTIDACSNIFNATLFETCCYHYADAYCDSWHHNTTRLHRKENLIAWTPFMVTGTAIIALQLVACIMARCNRCYAVDPQTKQVIERYQNKIQELRIEEV